jgi:hypothetical protein
MADTGRVLQSWWYPNPGDFDEPFIGITNPWDIVYLNGFAIPGVSKIQPGRGHKLNIKSSAGKHFATVTDEGYEPCDLVIMNEFYSPKHWEIWQLNILPMIEPDPGGKYEFPTVTIAHPAAYARRITAIQVKHILGPVLKGKGLATFTLRCIDFNSSKTNATNTPKNAGVAPFSNALVSKDKKPSHEPIPTKPPREA